MQNSHRCQLTSKNGPNFFRPIVGQVVKELIPVPAVLSSNSPDNHTLPWVMLTMHSNSIVSTLSSDKAYLHILNFGDILPYIAAILKGYLY